MCLNYFFIKQVLSERAFTHHFLGAIDHTYLGDIDRNWNIKLCVFVYMCLYIAGSPDYVHICLFSRDMTEGGYLAWVQQKLCREPLDPRKP